MSDQKTFYDEWTGLYFKSTKEVIDQAVEEANTILRQKIKEKGFVYVGEVMGPLYDALGINVPSACWQQGYVFSSDYMVCDSVFKEVKDSEEENNETSIMEEAMKVSEMKTTEFEYFDIAAENNDGNGQAVLTIKVKDGDPLIFALSAGNVKCLRKMLKGALTIMEASY